MGPAEAGRVTSVVRYEPGSRFAAHPHPGGEEILVLDGVFSDETGDYATGSYLLNPEGFSHAPFSQEGCVIFVKLKQYGGPARPRIALDTRTGDWQAAGGLERLMLFDDDRYPVKMWLTRMPPGAVVPHHGHPGGEEIFVIEGAIRDHLGLYQAGCWYRSPPGSEHEVVSEAGALIYVKRDHLAPAP